MSVVYISAGGDIAASAGITYEIIANYREHHPRILPMAFSDVRVEQGGFGAGTVISFKYSVAGVTRSRRDVVSEPEPGRVLTESDATGQSDKVTTFTVTPLGTHCRLNIEIRWTTHGIRGLIERVLAFRLVRPSLIDEIDRVDRYAQRLEAAFGSSSRPHRGGPVAMDSA